MKIGKAMIAGLGIASLLIALPAGAQSSSGSTGSGSSGATGSSGAMGPTSGGTASSASATGKVEKVDQSKNELTLRIKMGESTQVMKDGKIASISDIKEGDQVRASFSPSGAATRIDVMSAPAGGGSSQPGGSSTAPGGGSSGSSTPGGDSSSGSSSGRGY